MKKRTAFHAISFVFAAMFLALQLFAAPPASLRVQAAPVTYPDGTVFDPEYYAETYPDVKAAFGNDAAKLWQHYQTFGRKEGRKAAGSVLTFDPVFYAETYPDVKAALGTDAARLWQHFRQFGEKEMRKASKDHLPGSGVAIAPPAGITGTSVTTAPAASAAPVYHLSGKRVAFVGDSITTFAGQIPSGYETYYPWGDLTQLSQTWWYQVMAGSGMQLAINASWSGSCVTGDRNDTRGYIGSGLGRIRAVVESKPDIVIVTMGINDFGQCKRPDQFLECYNAMISQLRANLPQSLIICCTCLPQYAFSKNDRGNSPEDYNKLIRFVAAAYNCYLIDTAKCPLNRSHLIDEVHPTAAGAAVVAKYVLAHMPQIK